MNRLQREALCTEAFSKKPAEFYVVIDDLNQKLRFRTRGGRAAPSSPDAS